MGRGELVDRTRPGSHGLVAAFDLGSDPAELAPRPLTPVEVDAALSRARAWWSGHPLQAGPARWSTEDAETMRALGYKGS